MSIEKGITCSYTPGIYAEGYIAFVFPFVRSYVRSLLSVVLVEFTSKFSVKVSLWVYLSNHSSESIHIWTMGPLEGLLPCHEYLPQVSCPGLGPEVKI